MSKKRRPCRTWCQFSLGTLAALMLAVGLLSGKLGPIAYQSILGWTTGAIHDDGDPFRRTEQLILTREELRELMSEWESFWEEDKWEEDNTEMSPVKVHGGVI